MNKPDPLNDPVARREKIAGAKLAQMKSFFAGLSGPARRRLRRELAKSTGKKEGLAEMMSRVSREGGK